MTGARAIAAHNENGTVLSWRMAELVLKEGKGMYVWSENGDKYFDFTSGIGVTSTGMWTGRPPQCPMTQPMRLQATATRM